MLRRRVEGLSEDAFFKQRLRSPGFSAANGEEGALREEAAFREGVEANERNISCFKLAWFRVTVCSTEKFDGQGLSSVKDVRGGDCVFVVESMGGTCSIAKDRKQTAGTLHVLCVYDLLSFTVGIIGIPKPAVPAPR